MVNIYSTVVANRPLEFVLHHVYHKGYKIHYYEYTQNIGMLAVDFIIHIFNPDTHDSWKFKFYISTLHDGLVAKVRKTILNEINDRTIYLGPQI